MFKNWKAALAHVKAAVRRRVRSSDDVDELLQEACLRLAAYERHTPVDKPGAFLMRTALNLAIDARRARRVRGQQVPLDDDVLVDTMQFTVEDAVLAREHLVQLDAGLRALGDTTHDIYFRIRFQGMSYTEAARLFGMSVSGVEKHMAKATLLVAQQVGEWADET